MRLEDSIQIAIIDWVKLNGNLIDFVMHVRNEGKCSLRQGALAKRMGKKAGVSDLFIMIANDEFHGFWLELKSPKTTTSRKGTLSPPQKEFIKNARSQNYKAEVYYDAERAIEDIKHYLSTSSFKRSI